MGWEYFSVVVRRLAVISGGGQGRDSHSSGVRHQKPQYFVGPPLQELLGGTIFPRCCQPYSSLSPSLQSGPDTCTGRADICKLFGTGQSFLSVLGLLIFLWLPFPEAPFIDYCCVKCSAKQKSTWHSENAVPDLGLYAYFNKNNSNVSSQCR